MKVEDFPTVPLLSVSIVAYKTPLAVLSQTLQSLEIASRSLESVVVTLVNNDPAGGGRLHTLIEEVSARPGFWLVLLETGSNRGYGAGHNAALGTAQGEFHLVLNPDVELADTSLEHGLAFLQQNTDAVLLSPEARGGSGEREHLCKRHPSVFVLALRAFCPGLGERWVPERMARYEMRELAKKKSPQEVELASGCFMLMRTRDFLHIGAFDEQFFLYFEDFDLSLRMAPHGKVLYHPAVKIVHHGGYAARKGWRHLWMFARSGWRFFQLHGWRWI